MTNLSVSTTFVPDGRPLQEALELCKEAGVQSVEIGSNHCYEESYGYLSVYDFEYLVHNYFPIPQKSFVLNIASFDEIIRTMSIKHIKRAIDLCEKINAKLYSFHPGFLTDPKGSNNTNSNFDFQWDENQLSVSNFKKAKELMYNALDEVVDYAESKKINIAIETEGSLNKKDHLLMQQPKEYEEFMGKYSNSDIGINLNIGHLNLAANAFDFNRFDFIKLIQNYIVAMELSHNDGVEDQHLPLQANAWYWEIILDPYFESVYKILEFRNTQIS
ncbi:MAG: sugar phosphate isomerase/epimerase, partial [Candidatus Marinimicrobia bacterium]|nr:sugar phosphate isomerase/epimerase [Candidatus Neomarinimicrobiota bacterium]